MRRLVLILSVVGLFSCGGSNPGSGTKTLFVKASAETDGSTDGTYMAVEVRQGTSDGTLLTDAVVTIRGDKSGEFNLPWEGINFGNFRAGAYQKRQLAWDTGWTLQVKRGTDELAAYIEAPGVTTITDPIAATTFRRADGKPLAVRWKDAAGRRAQVVSIKFSEADGASATLSEDKGELLVEPNRLVQKDKEKVEITRKNEIPLAGGVPGSLINAASQHRIEFNVE